MCGIAGIISADPGDVNLNFLEKMTNALVHRGPDGNGHWINHDGKVGLGHRRLSIIDLSNEASQPLHYLNRYSIVFNGEIYNYIELRTTLQQNGYHFTTSSDTEVLIAYYDWKKQDCLNGLDGMFAFAIYDSKENKLFCARDRFGEKPFYYCHKKGGSFYFSSEMKALWSVGLPKQVDNAFIYNYIANGNIADPQNLSCTFYKNIFNLQPSCFLEVDVNTIEVRIKRYWDIEIPDIVNAGKDDDIKNEFSCLMEESVKRRLRSDVPVGSSLSGGLDSSLIVSLINKINDGKIIQNTFSARFPDFNKDEGKFMNMVIDKTNVTAYFSYPDPKGFIDDIDKLFYHQEEPFGSSSIYAQYCVMKLAKEKNITVLLDGQGADEVLAGYHAYFPVYLNEIRKKDKNLYQQEKDYYEKMYAGSFNYTPEPNRILFTAKQHSQSILYELKKWREFFRQQNSRQFTGDFFSAYRNGLFKNLAVPATLNGFLKQQTMVDMQQLLRFADRNSMAYSREVRLPFLNADLVSFLFSLPSSYKIKNGWTKWIMRTTFESLLPKEIAWRKDKVGFEPPQQSWMENKNFKDMLMASIQTLVKEGILNKAVLAKPLISHQVNAASDNYSWRYLMAGKMFAS